MLAKPSFGVIVYQLKSVGALECISTSSQGGGYIKSFHHEKWAKLTISSFSIYVPPDSSGKCIVRVPICSGMGAMRFQY